MPDLNVNLTNTVKSVGGLSQKNINNNTGRPVRTPDGTRAGQGGVIAGQGINAEENYAVKINEIRENAVKTIKMDIIEKALRDADIEVNQATLDIVKSLVNGSLPLTDNNIVNLLDYSHIFKDVSTDILALMMRLEIPITPENVEQFEKLISANEKLSDKISELINELPREILQNSRNLSELSDTLSKLLDIISKKDGGELPELRSGQLRTSDSRANINTPANSQTTNTPVLTRYELNGLLTMLRNLKAPDSVLNKLIAANRQNANILNNNQGQQQNANVQNQNAGPQNQAQAHVYQTRSDVMLDIINEFIRDTDSREQQLSRPANNNTGQARTPSNPPANDSAKAAETETFGKVKDLINSSEFQKLLKESMGERWLLNPKNLNPEKIEYFYNKLNENLNSIENRFAKLSQNAQNNNQVRQQSGEPNQPQPNTQNNTPPQIYLDAKNIRDNLSLMNEISKTMPFMQIPVKFANQTVNSDLYIFTNKKKNKNGANSSGGINALLRLDLENAGTLDIYLNMSGKNVRSRFHSQNMKSVQHIEKNLPDLEKTIKDMGFNFTSAASTEEKGFDFVGDFINRGVPKAEIRKYILNMKI